MTSTQQRIAELDVEIDKVKDGIYHSTLSPELYSELSLLLRDLEAELLRLKSAGPSPRKSSTSIIAYARSPEWWSECLKCRCRCRTCPPMHSAACVTS